MTSNELGNASANQSFNLWYHPLYTDGIHVEARFPRERYQILLNRLKDSEQFHMFAIREPRQISKDALLLAHDATYVEEFLEQKLSEKEMRRIGLTPWTPKMIERTLCLTGGALEATIHAVNHGGITGNMAGGTHHAHRDFGSGYCIFNDLAISAMYAIEKLGIKRVAILDLDVHQGDGTATILSNEARTRTISVHCSTNFPFRKSVSDFDLPVEPKAGDELFMEKVREAVELCVDFQPELVLYQAGVDGLEQDHLGKLCVTRKGMQERNQYVFEKMLKNRIPTVIFMGGGYSKPIEHSLDSFYDLFIDASIWNKRWS
ncbi:MAG TPA: histone deacetylase [Candidatus Poseidoniales archaeon]|nr:MAG TPA: histone deacetylase [Candidatus Poseidoniales archaeon]HII56115.1 histone deacetylase [Candidatus Poseidoniaceae archaeon]